MKTRLVSLLACLFVVALVQPAAASRVARQSSAIPLAKTNVITGTKTGYVRVSVDKPMTLDYGALTYMKGGYPRLFRKSGPSPSVEVTGKGDFIGLAITRDRAEAEPLFVSGQFRGSTEVDRVVNFSSPLLGRYIELAPGTYRVFLISDGKPASVRFTFDRGRSGTRRLQVATSTHSQAHATDSFTRFAAGGTMYAANEHVVKSQRSFAVDMLAVHGGEEVAEGFGVCINDLTGPLPLDYHGPRCGNGGDAVFVAGAKGRDDTFFMFLEDHEVTRGRWSFGGWYAGDAEPEYVGLHSLTIDRV